MLDLIYDFIDSDLWDPSMAVALSGGISALIALLLPIGPRPRKAMIVAGLGVLAASIVFSMVFEDLLPTQQTLPEDRRLPYALAFPLYLIAISMIVYGGWRFVRNSLVMLQGFGRAGCRLDICPRRRTTESCCASGCRGSRGWREASPSSSSRPPCSTRIISRWAGCGRCSGREHEEPAPDSAESRTARRRNTIEDKPMMRRLHLFAAALAALSLALVAPAQADALDGAIAFFNGLGIKQGGQPLNRDNVGKFTSLNLPKEAEIKDEHMVHVAALPAVLALNLSHSLVTDAGMPTLAKAPALRQIRLFNTEVGDEGVAALAGLAELTDLTLNSTPITAKALVAIAGFPKLETLTMHSTAVSAEGFAALQGLRTLRTLAAASMKSFSADTLPAIAGIAGLRQLQLGSIDLEGALAGLAGSNVRSLVLTLTRIGDADGVSLGQLSALDNLDLRSTRVGDETIAALGSLPNLKTLTLNGTQVTDGAGPGFAAMSKLTRLVLNDTGIGDALMPSLAGLPLERLSLDKTAVTDEGLRALAPIKTLKELTLANAAVTDAGVAALEAAIPGIKIRR